jgi:hypothetical protein
MRPSHARSDLNALGLYSIASCIFHCIPQECSQAFRATVITSYMKNGGKLETAQQIANHESPRTTKLYDRREEEISLDEVERIAI